jgi:broad specificity phosphatase PhoE
MPTLVRHAATIVDRDRPAHEWQLSDDGRAAARRLALSGPALSSTEDKALETARLAGLDARPDDRLREVARPWSDEYERDVLRYLAGEPLRGWESRDQALARLRAALSGFDGIAVTHGLAIALLAGLSFEEWRALPFPAVVEC